MTSRDEHGRSRRRRRSTRRGRAVEGAVVRLNQLVDRIRAIAQREIMQRRQPAGDIHGEHGAVAERAAVGGRPVETAVESLNHTGVRVRAIGTGKVMQGGECARGVEREDRSESVGATLAGGSVDETIGCLESTGRVALSHQVP